MILFEIYRQLDVRLYQTVNVLDRSYGAVGKYIIRDDNFIFLGYEHSVSINMFTKELKEEVPLRSFDLNAEPVLWFADDSAEGCVATMFSNAIRQWWNVDALNQADLYAELDRINKVLSQYNLRIIFDIDSMSIYNDGEIMTFEEALEHIMEIDSEQETEQFLPEWFSEAEYYRSANRLEEACERYERVIKHTNRSQPIYTTSAFHLAESYYFLGNYERAVKLYYRCNIEFITNHNDFYIHIGHALLDEKMKKYERQIKIYYHCRIDSEYALNHKQALEAASHEVADVFDEYEKTCLDMGMKKYKEHRDRVPKDADDIDEILAMDLKEFFENDKAPRRYENINLVDREVQASKESKSVNELLSEALDDYMNAEYQNAYNTYLRLKQEVPKGTDYYTWILFQLGKLYTITERYDNAREVLELCDPNCFGLVYRLDDYLVLLNHVKIICDDFESNPLFRKLIRGRIDSYYAKYDHTYHRLKTDSQLIAAYERYEKECSDASGQALEGLLGDDKSGIFSSAKSEPVMLKGLFKFFREKK